MKTFLILLLFLYSCDKIENSNIFIDERDGNEYEYSQFGEQTWMLENFRYFSTEKDYVNIDGQIYYSFDAANRLTPIGWHLPSDAEWQELIDFLGYDGFIKSEFNANFEGWIQGTLTQEHKLAAWWSSTECFNNYAWVYYAKDNEVRRTNLHKSSMLTIRYIRD